MIKRLYYLNPGAKSICSVHLDGNNVTTIVSDRTHVPDGIVISSQGHIYWTEMGEMAGDKDDGAIYRCNLDGSHITPIVPAGGTHTPKQLTLHDDRLFWCDREGMKVMSCSLDGRNLQILHDQWPPNTSRDAAAQDARNHCVGIAVDRDVLFWTQKGPPKGNQGRIFRSRQGTVDCPFTGLPEPIDLELCSIDGVRYLYWTDRGAPPNGNSVNRSKIGQDTEMGNVEVLSTGFDETIGVAIDVDGGRMYVTDLGGSIYSLALDGRDRQVLVKGKKEDQLTGICLAQQC